MVSIHFDPRFEPATPPYTLLISCLFTSGIKLGVKKFKNLIEFGLQDSSRVYYCLGCKLHIKNY